MADRDPLGTAAGSDPLKGDRTPPPTETTGPPTRGRDSAGSLDLYLKEISAHRLLTREEEVEVARRIRAGEREALDKLVRANLRFVVSVAKRYQNHGVALADLVNEGNMGLMRAAEKFDETKGVRFISYAVWWIRQAILQAISEQSGIVRVPSGRADRTHQVVREARALNQRLGRQATPDEVAAELGVPVEEVREALAGGNGYLSLDAPVSDSRDARLLDLIPSEEGETAHDRTLRAELRRELELSLTRLHEREALVLRLYFGLEDGEPRTLERIGDELGVSRERVRQIKDRALAKLRYGDRGSLLEGFYR